MKLNFKPLTAAACFVFMLACHSAYSQKNSGFSGKVTGAASQPLGFASVHILNSNYSTLTNAAGEFSFRNIKDGSYTVSASATGYATVTVNVRIGQNNEPLVIHLQDEAARLNEVVVTSQKKEEALQQVPVSITSLSSKEIQQYRLWKSNELSGIAPNLYSTNSGDERNVTSIRGIATTSYDPAVSTYIDGVNQFSLDTYIAQLLDIERIEVLRGPQGTLYGRNAMGGVINIITRQPTNKTTGFAELNYGNYNQQRYSAGVRTPLINNKLFFGAAVMFNKRDGYYDNEFTKSSFDKQQGISGNYYLKYIPAERWNVTVNVKHQNIKNNGAFPLVNGMEEAFGNPYKLSQDAVGRMIDNTLNMSLVINHAGPAFNFSSQSSWQSNHRYYQSPLDGDFSPLDAVTVINDYGTKWNNVKVFTQELRFTSPAGNNSPLKWTGGAYFFHQDNPVKQATHYGKDAGLLGVPDTDFSTINTSKGKNTGIAFFGQINYALTEKLELIAGLRYDYENRRLSVEGAYQKDGEDVFVTRPDTSAKTNFSALSPKLGLSYHASGNSNLFITYSRGFRTGGLTQLSQDPSQPPLYPYKPEYSNNIEAGIKNSFFNNKLRANLTAFVTLVRDAQVPTLVLPDAITVTRNYGKLTSRGIELELAATPLKGLQFDYNLGYTRATYNTFKNADGSDNTDFKNKRQVYTPDVTSMLAVQYSYTVNRQQQVKLVARGEWFYTGATYFDVSNNIRQSPYGLINTRVGVSSKRLDVFFWGRNLGGSKYIAYAYDFGAIHLGDPKTYGITVAAKF